MTRCLIVQPIHPSGPALLAASGIEPVHAPSPDMATVARLIPGCAAVITRDAGLSAAAINAADALRVIAVHGTGTDPVDLDRARARGITVINTPLANVRSVAEHAMALLLALAKRLAQADRAVRAGESDFRYRAAPLELDGATLGLVGFGRTGQAAATLARGFGMTVTAFSPRRPDADFAAAGIRRAPDLKTLLADSDAVSLHLPLTEETRGIIDAEAFAAMRPGALFVNTSRAGVVDEPALIEALRSGRLGGAGLDLFALHGGRPDPALLAQDRVILSPHIAGSTEAALRRAAEGVVAGILDVLAGRMPAHPVIPPGPAVS